MPTGSTLPRISLEGSYGRPGDGGIAVGRRCRQRDVTASTRDIAADARDMSADLRDAVTATGHVDVEAMLSRAIERDAAARDRAELITALRRAVTRLEAAARQRADIELDRMGSLGARIVAGHDREESADDRRLAGDRRRASATTRVAADESGRWGADTRLGDRL